MVLDRLSAPPTKALPAAGDHIPWWLWPQVLSLDAPLVAVLWGAALAKSHYLHLPAAFLEALGLAAWLIYLVDRVADDEPQTRLPSARHRFCQRHRRIVWPVIVAAGAWLVWLVLARLPVGLIGQGMAVAMLAVLYLAVFAAHRRAWLFRGLVLLALAIALSFVLQMPGTGVAAWWWRAGLGMVVALVFLRLLLSQGHHKPGMLAAFKEPLAALLFTLGCSTGVHFWAPPEHGVLCDETWLLWGLFTLNLWGIKAAERFHETPGLPLPVDQIVLATLLILAGEMSKGSSVGPGSLMVCMQFSALLLGLLPLVIRRVSLSLYHVLADGALVLPLAWFFSVRGG